LLTIDFAKESKRDMREWLLDQMRRRSRRGPNESESTGKSGQELPTGQQAPLRPSYPEPISKPVEENKAEISRTSEVPVELPPLEAASSTVVAAPDALLAMPDVPTAVPDLPEWDATPAAGFAPAEAGEKIVVETQPESLATPPAEQTPVKSPRGYVVLTIGLPGSGKTTWYKRRGVSPLSSEMLRSILFDDITDQRYQGLVFSTLRSLLRARLIAKMPWNYVDATNLSPHERRQWIKMAKSFGYEVQAVFFDVPLAVCLERNSKRDRQVTDEVMHKMAERLKPPAFKEGFDKITVVRVKGAEGAFPVAPAPGAAAEPSVEPAAEGQADAPVDDPPGNAPEAQTDLAVESPS
jgi:predicted kinase